MKYGSWTPPRNCAMSVFLSMILETTNVGWSRCAVMYRGALFFGFGFIFGLMSRLPYLSVLIFAFLFFLTQSLM